MAEQKAPRLPNTNLFINNEWVPSLSGKTFETINPSTGEVITSVAEGGAEDIDLAVKAARAAFVTWSKLDGAVRARYLFKLADLIESRIEEIALLETTDNGMNLAIAKGVAKGTADTYRFYAGYGDKLESKHIPLPGHHVYTLYEPYGVCAGVLPWNFPFILYSWKLAPALVAGNTFVLKPSEKTPLTALLLGELLQEIGLPAGVINIVNGYGSTGAALASHMDVDKIAFTGSVATGKKIMEAAAKSNLKKVTLELGGKSPLIVLADANLDVAVEVAHQGLFVHQGQVCVAASRIFVQESIYSEFVKRSVERAKKRTIGTPLVPTNETGPIVDKIQFDKVLSYIDVGKKEGAKLLHGGCVHGDKGYFIEPTVFADVEDSMTIAREEIFGPVMSLLKFKDIDEVVRRANDSPFGLAASVISNDVRKVHTIASQLRAGTVWVNCHGVTTTRTPFGGYKQSGIGRENGEEGLKEYQVVKTVCISLK